MDGPFSPIPAVRFTVTSCTAGHVEVVTSEGVEVWEEGKVLEQGKLWKGTWPRRRPDLDRPRLRLIKGGKA